MAITIEKQYQEWLSKVYGRKGLTKDQKEEMRKAFYSGAFVMLCLMDEISSGNTEDISCTKIEIINQELSAQIIKWSE